MATPTIRGHKGQFKIFENGELKNIVDITSVEINQDSTMQRSFFVGRPVPEGDQTQEGWSGSIDLEVRNAIVEDFIDALVTNNLNGIGVSDYAFTSTEEYSDGTRRTYVYSDAQFKFSRSASGLTEKITRSLEFQASFRIRL